MSETNNATLKNLPKASAGPGFATSAPHTLSVSELRTAMQQHLRKNGTLKVLKTHVRGMLLTELMHQQKRFQITAAQQRAPSDRDGVIPLETFERLRQNEKCEGSLGESAQQPDQRLSPSSSPFSTWASCLADALIEEHLRTTRRNMSLAIFSTEVEIPPLSDIGAPSDEQERLEQLLFIPNSPTKNRERESLEDHGIPRASVLQRLVMQRLVQSDAQHLPQRSERGAQTEDDLAAPVAGETLTSLECRLAAVDAKYALTFSRLGHSNDPAFFTRSEVERRLNSYKSDIHEQLRREYQQKHKLFEENKLREFKESLEGRYQLMIQNKNEELREMERALLVKYEQERQRLQRSREDVERQRLDIERHQKEMSTIVSDYEAQLTEQEAAQNGLREKLRVAQLQSAKWEELSGSRLMEAEAARSREQRRVDDIRRMQADHAAELRLKDEEISRLQFRMRMLVNRASDRATKGDLKAGDKAPDAVQGDLYGMLVRTEELQRNALQQQQTWMAQASREQQWHQERSGGAVAWGNAPAQAAAALPTLPPPAAARSAREPWEAPAATTPLDTVENPVFEKKAAETMVGVLPAPQPSQKADVPQESPVVVRESSGEDASQPLLTISDSENPPRNLSSSLVLQESIQKDKNRNTEDQHLVPNGSSTGSSPASSKLTGSASDTSELSEGIKKSSKGSRVSCTSNNVDNSEEDSRKAAELERILEEEEAPRKDIQSDENNAYKGIMWAEDSQRKVIKAKLAERLEAENVNHGGELRGIDFSMRRLVTQQQQNEGIDIIFGDSDNDDDHVLFNSNSTGSSI